MDGKKYYSHWKNYRQADHQYKTDIKYHQMIRKKRYSSQLNPEIFVAF